MKKFGGLVAALLLSGIATAASATQYTIPNDVVGNGTSYIGPGSLGLGFGAVGDGGRDAFDTYGGYVGSLGGLTFTRQTEAFQSLNLYRFYDTFTNSTGAAITQTLTFSGDLGSDGGTVLKLDQPGLAVTCQGSTCGSDPAIAHVYSNNGMGTLSLTAGTHSSNDRFNVAFDVTVGAGQSISLLNFAFLASDINGTLPSDFTLASNTGLSLQQNPYTAGLSEQQLNRVVNFDLGQSSPGAVPEPSAWALMLAGFGLAGASLRSRRRVVAA